MFPEKVSSWFGAVSEPSVIHPAANIVWTLRYLHQQVSQPHVEVSNRTSWLAAFLRFQRPDPSGNLQSNGHPLSRPFQQPRRIYYIY